MLNKIEQEKPGQRFTKQSAATATESTASAATTTTAKEAKPSRQLLVRLKIGLENRRERVLGRRRRGTA